MTPAGHGAGRDAPEDRSVPDLSLVLPCYNEADSLRVTALPLLAALRERQVDVELILVDNGSVDATAEVIDQLVAEGHPVRKETVEVNQGYGLGVLTGLRAARGRMVGFMCADGQIDEDDVAKLCALAVHSRTPRLFKVRRRFRMEGIVRRIVSMTYNVLTRELFGDVGSMDINANPKLVPRHVLERMRVQSTDWFLDAEVMIKARRMGLGVFELNVFSQPRMEGASHVRPATVWEFLRNLMSHRFGGGRRALIVEPLPAEEREAPAIGEPRHGVRTGGERAG